jgi:hypothetical protein
MVIVSIDHYLTGNQVDAIVVDKFSATTPHTLTEKRKACKFKRSLLKYALHLSKCRKTLIAILLLSGLDKGRHDSIVGHNLPGVDVYFQKPSNDDLMAAMEQDTAWIGNQFAKGPQNSIQETLSR